MHNEPSAYNELIDQFKCSCNDSVARAKLVLPGLDESWGSYMASFKLQALSVEEKANIIMTTNQGDFKGAVPSELRQILDHHQKSTLRLARERYTSADKTTRLDVDRSTDYSEFKEAIEKLVKEFISNYVNKNKQSFTTQGIFANAMMTSVNCGHQEEQVNTKTCDCCGAARPIDENMRVCQFCGNDFFG